MARPRFNDDSQRRELSRSVMGSHVRWIGMPELDWLRDSKSSGRNRIFAAVSRPIPTGVEGKTIRRILIFDNHPDSLRVVFETGVDLGSDDEASSRRERRTSIICGSILIAMVVTAMLWTLLW